MRIDLATGQPGKKSGASSLLRMPARQLLTITNGSRLDAWAVICTLNGVRSLVWPGRLAVIRVWAALAGLSNHLAWRRTLEHTVAYHRQHA